MAIPYFWLVEALSPVIELAALVAATFALINGWIDPMMVMMFFGIGILWNLQITLVGIYFDNRYVSKNNSWSITRSVVETVLLHFGYKQINSLWRLLAMMKSFSKAPSWGEKPRQEITHHF
jgi:hypothetical protein